jgi:hypothetical protein
MRLKHISIKNYRSIKQKTDIALSDFTSLIGPNNEGKTNILRALTIAFAVIHNWKNNREISNSLELSKATKFLKNLQMDSASGLVSDYIYARDYPKHGKGKQPTEIELRFTLTEEELADFRRLTGLRNNDELPLVIRISKQKLSLSVKKQGPSSENYNKKIRDVAEFIDERIGFMSVPAIRDANQMLNVAQEFAQAHLSESLSEDNRYRTLIEEIAEIEGKYLHALSENITNQIQGYAANISSVRLIPARKRNTVPLIERLEITDDVVTSSTEKGEGLQSLIAIGLIQEATRHLGNHKAYILAIDEPEAHLHPDAVRIIGNTLRELAQKQQVIVATHSSILVGQTQSHTNVLIQNSKADTHPTLEKIRSCLGIALSDSLTSAPICILVEGATDRAVYKKLLCDTSPKIRHAFEQSLITIRSTNGTKHLQLNINIQRQFLNKILILLDGDQAGRDSCKHLISSGIVDHNEIRHIPALGRPNNAEVELEDIFNPDLIVATLNESFGHSFSIADFKQVANKWSANFINAATSSGLYGKSEELLKTAKISISHAVESEGTSALREEYKKYITNISSLLEQMIIDHESPDKN